jgi:hypothetical protein
VLSNQGVCLFLRLTSLTMKATAIATVLLSVFAALTTAWQKEGQSLACSLASMVEHD